MATPSRNLILENIFTSLSAIDGTGNFKTTLKKVERHVKEWESVGSQEMPWAGFMPIRTLHTHQPGTVVRCVMELAIVAHVNESTDAGKSDSISDVIDDIWEALNIDTTRGGNAVMTTIMEVETDEGDPDSIDSKGGTGSAVVRANVVYNRDQRAT